VDGVPRIELLWSEGCPSTPRALAMVRTALDELELGGCEVTLVEVRTHEDAERLGFRGSPTILIGGIDLVDLVDLVEPVGDGGRAGPGTRADGGDDEPAALGCRLYRRRDGRISPTPDPADVRDGLRLAVAAR
jgi:hypothetical protein